MLCLPPLPLLCATSLPLHPPVCDYRSLLLTQPSTYPPSHRLLFLSIIFPPGHLLLITSVTYHCHHFRVVPVCPLPSCPCTAHLLVSPPTCLSFAYRLILHLPLICLPVNCQLFSPWIGLTDHFRGQAETTWLIPACDSHFKFSGKTQKNSAMYRYPPRNPGNTWEGRGPRNTLHAGPTYCFPFPLYNTGAPWPRDSGKEGAALLEGEKSLALQEQSLHTGRQVLSFDLGGSGTKRLLCARIWATGNRMCPETLHLNFRVLNSSVGQCCRWAVEGTVVCREFLSRQRTEPGLGPLVQGLAYHFQLSASICMYINTLWLRGCGCPSGF